MALTLTTVKSTNTLWIQLKDYLVQIKTDWQVLRDAMAAGDTAGIEIERLAEQASTGIQFILDSQAAGSDFVDEVRLVERDPLIDVATELTNLLTSHQALTLNIDTIAPTDGSGWWSTAHQYIRDVNGIMVYTPRLFTPSATSSIRADIDDVLVNIL